MSEKKLRKTDRRTLYTKMVIKDALLALLKNHGFEKATVTALCREAGITRATFYLHYLDLWTVIDEILADALQLAEDRSSPASNTHQVLQQLLNSTDVPKKLQEQDALLPVCQRVAALPKYRVLFLDATLSPYIVSRLFDSEKEKMIPWLMTYCHLPREEAEMLFRFTMYGAFAVNVAMNWTKDDKWYHIQSTLLKFIYGGADTLAKNNTPTH